MGVAWVDGELVDERAPQLTVTDHAFLVGDGVFETLQVVRGTPFALTRHLRRLRRSADALRIALPDDVDLAAGARHLLDATGTGRGRLRITVSSGPGPLGSGRGHGSTTVVMAVGPVPQWEPLADVVTVPWTRNERGALAGVKTTSYAENVRALARAHEAGASEAIFANTRGNLCEGTGTNVFVGLGGRLVTPPLSAGPLPGITRELLLELVPVEEADLPLDQLAQADEAFLTSSTRDVQPIRAVDGHALPTAPGPLTRRAATALADLIDRDLDP